MPNHITTRITSDSPETLDAIKAILLNDEGRVDLHRVVPTPEGFISFNSIIGSSEHVASNILGLPRSDDEHDFMRNMQDNARLRSAFDENSDEVIVQAIDMVKNYKLCGYFSWYDWNTANLNTKWNAYDTEVSESELAFDTAWATPLPVLNKLAADNPDMSFLVRYADEDIGSNCGTLKFAKGECFSEDVAPRHDTLTETDQGKWNLFALSVKYPNDAPSDMCYDENGIYREEMEEA